MEDFMNSVKNLALELIETLKSTIGEEHFIKLLTTDSLISKRINLLQKLHNGLNINVIPEVDKFELYCCLSDCLSLSIASGAQRGTFDSISINDISLLDKKKEIINRFNGNTEKLLEWMFSKKVQADINHQFEVTCKDLENDPLMKKKGKVCDYLIENSNSKELIEIKKIHCSKKPENWIAHCSNKIKNLFSLDVKIKGAAASQLLNTSKVLGITDATKHLIVNITGYSSKGLKKGIVEGIKYIGFHEEEIKVLLSTIKRKVNHEKNIIDKLSITWDEQIYINNTPIAISCRSRSIDLNINNSFYSFDGGSVEAYPNKKGEMVHIRVSKKTSCHNRLAMSYLNVYDPDSFGTSSEWVIVPKTKKPAR
jgi:hypothetical protein